MAMAPVRVHNDGITLEDRERALDTGHSATDQRLLRVTTHHRRQRRARRLGPVVLQTINRHIKAVHDDIVINERSTLEAVLRWGAYTVTHGYGQAVSFAAAHAGGFVSPDTWRYRRDLCHGCTLRERSEGHDFCTAPKGGRGCGCSRRPWWPFSRLNYWLWLGAWGCPLERFGPGSWRRRRAWQIGVLGALGGLILAVAQIVA